MKFSPQTRLAQEETKRQNYENKWVEMKTYSKHTKGLKTGDKEVPPNCGGRRLDVRVSSEDGNGGRVGVDGGFRTEVAFLVTKTSRLSHVFWGVTLLLKNGFRLLLSSPREERCTRGDLRGCFCDLGLDRRGRGDTAGMAVARASPTEPQSSGGVGVDTLRNPAGPEGSETDVTTLRFRS